MLRPRVPRRAWTLTVLVSLLYLCAGATDASAGPDRYKGRPLTDALRALQAAGLRIVFSSEIVTPDLRVVAEPRSKLALEILDELLKPHGLRVERGPGLVMLVVRLPAPVRVDSHKPVSRATKSRAPVKALEAVEALAAMSGSAYTEDVLVTADTLQGPRSGVGAEMTLGPSDLNSARSVLTDDPVRAIQSLPRVVAADDFRNAFSVRGSAYRHIGVVVDGVATPWLQHAAYGRGDAGSLAMFSSDVLEQATLQAGAYPQRDGDWLGAQLGLTLREGSRTDTRVRASITGTNAALVAEGPLGRGQRGSWLVAARQSYLDWPIRRRNALNSTVFGFADAQAKLAYDVRPEHKVSISALGGRSGIDGPDDRAPGELANGTNHAGMLIVRWDATLGHSFRLSQQANVVSHRFRNKYQSGEDAARGANGEVSYRIDMIRTLFGGLLEAGGQARRTHASRSVGNFDRAAYHRSAYVNFAWTPTPRFVLTPGLRLSSSTLASRATLGRWILGQWSIHNGWTLNASAGVSGQFPDFPQAPAAGPLIELAPERAAHAEIGIAQRVGRSFRWQAGIFSRRERDVLRGPDTLFESLNPVEYQNALVGSSSGVEVLVERRAARGLSGWAGYSYGKSRYTDGFRNETFWADFDQRHALNVHAHYALSDRTAAAVTFRGGSNFPIPGYLAARQPGVPAARSGRGGVEEQLFAGAQRNAVRLPPYARLDLRAERTFDVAARRVTVFVEVVNVLNRRNMGLADGLVHRGTGQAVGFTEPLFPRLPSAGLRVEF